LSADVSHLIQGWTLDRLVLRTATMAYSPTTQVIEVGFAPLGVQE